MQVDRLGDSEVSVVPGELLVVIWPVNRQPFLLLERRRGDRLGLLTSADRLVFLQRFHVWHPGHLGRWLILLLRRLEALVLPLGGAGKWNANARALLPYNLVLLGLRLACDQGHSELASGLLSYAVARFLGLLVEL